MQGDRELCLEAGMDDYLAKPISVKELVTALSQCRALARGATPAGDAIISGDGAIDRSVLVQTLESVGGDREFLDQVLATYRQDAPDLIAALQAAQAPVDADALRRAAHSLKSTSASVGAIRLAAACKELEVLAKDGDLTQAAARITRIEAEYAAVEAALQVYQTSA
jgi:HPt (histidine-containing phosphotransfer) domain-containing protein